MHGNRRVLLATVALALSLQPAISHAATIVVTDAGDPGNGVCDSVCTLREAITQANGTLLADTINFAIPTPVKTEIVITLASALPTITRPLTINGYSATFTSVNTLASGTDAKLRVRVDGANSVGRAFTVCSDSVRIKGLSITGFTQIALHYGSTAAGALCAGSITGGVVSGNFIGLRSDGSTTGGNGIGVAVTSAQVVIGGDNPADRNIISASLVSDGISLTNAASSGSSVLNNLIGTERTGTLDRGNAADGVRIGGNVTDVVAGKATAPNTIAYNSVGIALSAGTPRRNTWYANNVFGDDQLGIDIGENGVTANDANDADAGPNNLQNFPVITTASRVPGGLSVAGSLDVGGASASFYRIALYASAACDASGNGEGERFLGAVDRSLSSPANETFAIELITADPLPPGTVITATATDPEGNSSEFSACFQLDPPPLTVNTNADTDDGTCNAANCTLREAINAANARAGADVISFAIGSGLKVISPASPLPTITDTVAIDGYTQPGSSPNTLETGDDAVIAIQLDGPNAGASTSGLGICADDSVVRGLAVTRFKQAGIRVGGTTTGANCGSGDPTGVVLAGNFVGLLPNGSVAGNLSDGINVRLSDGTRIGGGAAADRNVISANAGCGIVIAAPSNDRQLDNNYIGTDPGGTQDRGNASAGLLLSTNADNVRVGELARNRIGFNQNGIVMIQNTGGTSNTFARNDIFSNDGLGIDIDTPGVTPNDPNDADIGGNGVQNFPELTLAQRTAGGVRIEGSLDVTADTIFNSFAFAIYANASCDPSQHGEGERYLGTFSLKLGQPPNASESFSFDLATQDPLPVGTQITATATDPGGNTSEFSECIAASDPSTELVVTSTADTGGTTCGATCTLRQAINAANLQVGENQITFAIPSGPFVIAPATPLPTITDEVSIDGYSQLGASRNALEEGDDAVILIRIDGAGTAGPAFGLGICGNQTSISGLSITRFPGAGVGIGFDATGAACASAPSEVQVTGSFIGLAPDGSAAGNQQGVVVGESEIVAIGVGPGAGSRNLISANGNSGVSVLGAGIGRRVNNNYIGIGPGGEGRGNLVGVLLAAQCAGAGIGDIAPNRIAFNGTGLQVAGAAGTGNTFDANEFFGNDALGIDLGANGVTANDADDTDGGGNGGQNFPVLDSVTFGETGITVKGSLDVPAATSNANYRVTVYESAACDSSGHGEGGIVLFDFIVPLSGGAESFEIGFKTKLDPPAAGHALTATATDPAGSTSEFSSCLVVPAIEGVFSDSFE